MRQGAKAYHTYTLKENVLGKLFLKKLEKQREGKNYCPILT